MLPKYNLCNECIGLANELIEETEDEHITTLQWLIRLGIKPKTSDKLSKVNWYNLLMSGEQLVEKFWFS